MSAAEAKNRRRATAPKLPTALNRCVASAEPSCALKIPRSTRTVGGIEPRARPARAVGPASYPAPAGLGSEYSMLMVATPWILDDHRGGVARISGSTLVPRRLPQA